MNRAAQHGAAQHDELFAITDPDRGHPVDELRNRWARLHRDHRGHASVGYARRR